MAKAKTSKHSVKAEGKTSKHTAKPAPKPASISKHAKTLGKLGGRPKTESKK